MTTTASTAISPADILPMSDYGAIRKARRGAYMERKARRTLAIGPYATALFESRESMWLQIHEMLFIERGGAEQVADELAAYNPMIPNGRELTATLLFEIDDPRLRKTILSRLGGVENHIRLRVGSIVVEALPEDDVERTREDGKASAVQFLHFPFSEAAVAAFRDPANRVMFEITHPNYGHIALLEEATRAELAGDFT